MEARERLARAIWSAMIWDTDFPNIGTDDHLQIMATADAALAAMRDPNDVMVAAGEKTWADDQTYIADMWRAMIDAASNG